MFPANTPKPPYYAVIFTAETQDDLSGYHDMVEQLRIIVEKQDGFLGMESAGEQKEITVSYWKDEESIRAWKADPTHQSAQKNWKKWYKNYSVRVCKVKRDYLVKA